MRSQKRWRPRKAAERQRRPVIPAKRIVIVLSILAVAVVSVLAVVMGMPGIGRTASQTGKPARPAWLASRQEQFAEVKVENTVVYARLAITPEQRVKGLSGTPKLEPEEGMLFVFERKDIQSFWMYGMLIPLDILWIDGDTVVDIKADLPNPTPDTPTNQLPIYQPVAPATHVLEVNAGWAKANNVTVGSKVEIKMASTPSGSLPLFVPEAPVRQALLVSALP